jgi:putative RNA 2'-phosphotransferase
VEWTLLSKTVSHALRHDPAAYGLALDDQGWGDIECLIRALRTLRGEWGSISSGDLIELVSCATKRRHEIRGNRIRALYGHSLDEKIRRIPSEPPPVLFHGTDRRALEHILEEGLRRMGRQYVHLTSEKAYALSARSRRIGHPVLLEIRATDAWKHGIQFYQANAIVWLTMDVPITFLERFTVGEKAGTRIRTSLS